MTTKEKLELLRQLNRQDILDAMLVLDSSDKYAVGNQYYNVVLNPDNENSYPLRELLSTALDAKGLTYEGDVLFEKPSVGSPMYLIFDELGFDYMSKNELFFRGFEKDDIEDFKNIISHLSQSDLSEFFNVVSKTISQHKLTIDDQRIVFKCHEDEEFNKGSQINHRLIFFISSGYNCDLCDNHESERRFGFKSNVKLNDFKGVSYESHTSTYYRVDHAIQALNQEGYHKAIEYDLEHSKRSNQTKNDNPIFRKACFDDNFRDQVLDYHKLIYFKKKTKSQIRTFLNQITQEGIALAMDEIVNNSFPRTRRIKYYKAVHKESKKAFAPPLLIEKAYEHSVHKELPAGFFKGIGKGSEFFKFLEENGFDVLKTEINMTYQEFLANLTYNDFELAINERGHEIEMDEWKKHSVFYQGKYYNSRKLIRLTDPNNDIANTDNYSSYTSITATKYLSDIGFNMNGNEIRYYIKRVLNQDVERTFSISNQAATDFFELELENGEEHTISLNYVNQNQTEETVIQKRNTRNEHRFFPEFRDEIEEGDILLFQNNNGDYSMEIIKRSEKFEDLDLLLNGKNHLLTDSLQVEQGINLKESKMSKQPLNQILYGPPGTGKTYSTITKALVILGFLEEKESYSDDEYSNAQKVFKKELGKRIEFVTMHQSFSYEDFLQGLKPEKSEDGQGVVFNYKDGVFKSICDSADENRILVKKDIKDEIETDRLFPSFMLSIDENTVYSLLSKYVFDNNKVPQYRAIEYFNDKLGKKYCKAWRDKFDYVLEDESPRVGYQPDKFREGELDAFHRYAEEFKQLNKIERARKLKNEWFKVKLHTETDIEQVNNYVIILDEINRCNVSKVFGELITLIEDDKRDNFETTLPSGERFTVPKNLYIIGTMNTADKSISMVDIALRRRFEFQAMYPNSGLVRDVEKRKFMNSVNSIIRDRKSIDFEIGHSDFMKSLSFEETLNKKVIPLLVEYFRNDMDAVKDIVSECIDTTSSVRISEAWFERTGLVMVEQKSN